MKWLPMTTKAEWQAPAGGGNLGAPWRLYRLGYVLARPLLGLFGRLDVVGRENIPDEGALLVANHIGWADPMWLMAATWPRPLLQMAKRELFTHFGLGEFIAAMGAFPVDRASPGTSAIKIPLNIIGRGGMVGIFPGGRRAETLEGVKRGAATIAAMSGCPVVVARYEGPPTLKIGQLFRRPQVKITFYPPLPLHDEEPPRSSRKNSVQRISHMIEAALRETDGTSSTFQNARGVS